MRLRIRAFLIHFAASCALGLAVMGLVFGVWYPAPLYKAVGVTDIFFIVLAVDVVIGPLLTFIVYRAGKKSLRFDLATIICLQLIAFSYGLWTVAEGRPAWVVFGVDRFDLIQVYEIDSRKLDQAPAIYRTPSLLGPKWVSARRATPEERNDVLFESMFAGVDTVHRPNFYRELSVAADGISRYAQPLKALEKFNSPAEVARVLAKWPEADAYLPLMARVHPMSVLIVKESAKIIAVVDLNPWE